MSLSQCHQCWFLESGWSFETRPGILMRWAQTFHPICQAIAITNLKAVEVFDFRVWIHRRLSQKDQVWGPGLVKQVWGTEALCRGRRKLAITGQGADYGPILAALLQNTLSLNRLFLSLLFTHELITGCFLTICIRKGLVLVIWAPYRLLCWHLFLRIFCGNRSSRAAQIWITKEIAATGPHSWWVLSEDTTYIDWPAPLVRVLTFCSPPGWGPHHDPRAGLRKTVRCLERTGNLS